MPPSAQGLVKFRYDLLAKIPQGSDETGNMRLKAFAAPAQQQAFIS